MDISDFDFELPEKLIAQHPPEVRGSSRLLVALPTLPIEDKHFGNLPDYVAPGDVLVFNNTKVMKARLFGQKASGGKIEALIERVLDAHTALAHIRSSKSPKPGTELIFEGDIRAVMLERAEELFCLKFEGEQTVYELLEQNGHLPLPPYIERAADDEDDSRYQTVYAKYQGAVAAPTAGLHFDDELLQKLHEKGVNFEFVTLHVGAGTFQPVRVENIEDHIMHAEYVELSQEVCNAIIETKKAGKRVIAVGTTSVRSVETAALSAEENGNPDLIEPYFSDTSIFIYPGKSFRVVDALITNFHLPESTLIMLVSAFAGFSHTMNTYKSAVENRFRFFSYGDAMFITKNPNVKGLE